MLNTDKVMAQLKLAKPANVAAASKWSDKDIREMMDTYLKTKTVAKKTGNTSLLMIAEEKISQLKAAVELKNKSI